MQLSASAIDVIPDRYEKYAKEERTTIAYNFSRNIPLPKPPSKVEVDDEEKKHPPDSYSFLALHGPCEEPLFFAFGLMPFVFQCTLSLLMILSVVLKDLRTVDINQEADNPGNPYTGGIGFMSQTFPANTGYLPRTTQIVSIISYMIFADGTLLDIARAIELFPPFWSKEKGFERHGLEKLFLSCVLRFIQGILAFAAVFLLVFTESSVIDIVLNFTAVNFISEMDSVAFNLARSGKFGRKLKLETKRIEDLDLPAQIRTDNFTVRYALAVALISMTTLVGIGSIVYFQTKNDKWITDIFRVQFGPDSGLEDYSGCFQLDKTTKRKHKRFTYNSYKHTDSVKQLEAKLGYCKTRRQWVFYKVNDDESDDPCSNEFNMLAHSRRSGSYDISTSIREEWFSFYNTPMDMYFVDKNETELLKSCGSFVNDGICDPDFNNFYYQFDGGDCCASTCSGDKCGRLDSTSEDVHYPFCEDQEMANLTLKVSVKEMNGVGLTSWANQIKSREDWEHLWRPRLVIECDGYRVLDTNRLECLQDAFFEQKESGNEKQCINAMQYFEDYGNASGSIQTKINADAKKCIITKERFDLVWSVTSDISGKPNGTAIEEIRVNPLPMEFEELNLFELPPENTTDQDESQSLLEITKGKGSNEWIDVDLRENHFTGSIPTAIGSISNVRRLFLDNNNFIGTIPIELFTNLASLEELSIANNALTGTLSPDVSFLTSLTRLSLHNNGFTGVLPSGLKQLTNLNHINLARNSFIGFLPNWNLTNLEYLNLGQNGYFGKLPSGFFSSLEKLTHLDLSDMDLTGTIPTEIGKLTKLTALDLGGNSFTGTIPTEIGLLQELITLDIGNNQLEDTIPTEIGSLTKLSGLWMYYNNLIGTIPCKLESLSKLTELNLSFNKLTGMIPQNLEAKFLHVQIQNNGLLFGPRKECN